MPSIFLFFALLAANAYADENMPGSPSSEIQKTTETEAIQDNAGNMPKNKLSFQKPLFPLNVWDQTPYEDKSGKKIIMADAFGYAMPYEEEEFAVNRAGEAAYRRAIDYAKYPLESLLADIAGGKAGLLNERFYGEYIKMWRQAFAYEHRKRNAATIEWVRGLGTRARQTVYVSLLPTGKKDTSFKIKASIDGKKHYPGDSIKGSLKATKDCFIRIFNVSSEGYMDEIYPEPGKSGFIMQGEKISFDTGNLFADEDAGQWLLHIIAVKDRDLKFVEEQNDNKEAKYGNDDDLPNLAEGYARDLRNFSHDKWASVIIPYEVLPYSKLGKRR